MRAVQCWPELVRRVGVGRLLQLRGGGSEPEEDRREAEPLLYPATPRVCGGALQLRGGLWYSGAESEYEEGEEEDDEFDDESDEYDDESDEEEVRPTPGAMSNNGHGLPHRMPSTSAPAPDLP